MIKHHQKTHKATTQMCIKTKADKLNSKYLEIHMCVFTKILMECKYGGS